MCVCVCVRVCVCVCVCVLCVRACIGGWVRACEQVYMHVHVCASINVEMLIYTNSISHSTKSSSYSVASTTYSIPFHAIWTYSILSGTYISDT